MLCNDNSKIIEKRLRVELFTLRRGRATAFLYLSFPSKMQTFLKLYHSSSREKLVMLAYWDVLLFRGCFAHPLVFKTGSIETLMFDQQNLGVRAQAGLWTEDLFKD